MILPLLPFLMTIEPEIVRTDSPPIVMTFEQGKADETRFEICADRIRSTNIGFDDFQGQPTLSVMLADEAKEELDRLTAQAIGKKVPITLEGQLITEPYVRERIASGGIMITGAETAAEVERLERAARGRCSDK